MRVIDPFNIYLYVYPALFTWLLWSIEFGMFIVFQTKLTTVYHCCQRVFANGVFANGVFVNVSLSMVSLSMVSLSMVYLPRIHVFKPLSCLYMLFNTFKPEFTIVIFIHHKPRVTVALEILNLHWMKMTWIGCPIIDMVFQLLKQFREYFLSKPLHIRCNVSLMAGQHWNSNIRCDS